MKLSRSQCINDKASSVVRSRGDPGTAIRVQLNSDFAWMLNVAAVEFHKQRHRKAAGMEFYIIL